MKKSLTLGLCLAFTCCLFSCGESEQELTYEEAKTLFNSYISEKFDTVRSTNTIKLEKKETRHKYNEVDTLLYEVDITKGDYYYYETSTSSNGSKTEHLIAKNDDHYEQNGYTITDEKAQSSVQSNFYKLLNYVVITGFVEENYAKTLTFYKMSDKSLKIINNMVDSEGAYTSTGIINSGGLQTYISTSDYLKTEIIELKFNIELNKKRQY